MKNKMLSACVLAASVLAMTACGKASDAATVNEASVQVDEAAAKNDTAEQNDAAVTEEKRERKDLSCLDGYFAKLGEVYDIVVPCYDDPSLSTTGKLVYTNYEKYTSEQREAKDGYEWRTVDAVITFGDENAVMHGFGATFSLMNDYYGYIEEEDLLTSDGENGDSYISAKDGQAIYGVNLTRYEYGEWTGGIAEFEFSDSCSLYLTLEAMVPVDYDGLIWGNYNESFNEADILSGGNLDEIIINNMVPFRLDNTAELSAAPTAASVDGLIAQVQSDVAASIIEQYYMDNFDGNWGNISLYYNDYSDDVEGFYQAVYEAIEQAGCTDIKINEYMEISNDEEKTYTRTYMYKSPLGHNLNTDIQIFMNGIEAYDGDFAGTHISYPAYHTLVNVKYYAYEN